MLDQQARKLHDAGMAMLEKAQMAADLKGATAYSDLALRMLDSSREVWVAIRINSVLAYFECCVRLGEDGDYRSYLEFCARNGLETIASEDFEQIGNQIDEAVKSKG